MLLKKSSCLRSSFHECSLSFNSITISGGVFAFSICCNDVKQRYFFQQGSYTTLLEGFHTHEHTEGQYKEKYSNTVNVTEGLLLVLESSAEMDI